MVAAKLANMRQGERVDLEPSANLQKVSQSGAADLLNVSTRAVASAAKVRNEGTLELINAVERGVLPVSSAAQIASAPATAQHALIADAPSGKA